MLGMFIAIRIWQFPRLLSGQSYIYGIKMQICMYKGTFASIWFSISLYPHILKIMSLHWYLQFPSNTIGFIPVFSFSVFIPSFSNNEEPNSSHLWLMCSFSSYVTHLCSPHLASFRLRHPVLGCPHSWTPFDPAWAPALCTGWPGCPPHPIWALIAYTRSPYLRTPSSGSDHRIGQPFWEVTPLFDLSSDICLGHCVSPSVADAYLTPLHFLISGLCCWEGQAGEKMREEKEE